MNTLAASRRPRTLRRIGRVAFRYTEHCLALVGLGTIVFYLCFDISRMASESMSPTLCGWDYERGDLVLTERVSYWFRNPRRWEVITFRAPAVGQVMKRVVGLPGERVRMLPDGQILINGRKIPRPEKLRDLEYFPYGNLAAGQTADCGDGYYVLGDFSRDSDDSRFNGPVKPEQIVGRAWVILSPAERRGWVDPD